jgi:hypothetical protein
MFKSKQQLYVLVALITIVCLGIGAPVQANDVDCSGCVDSSDIASKAIVEGKLGQGAVTSAKIQKNAVTSSKIVNGAVILDKVEPALKNAIGTSCPPGEFVVGKDTSGNLVCELPAPN